MPFNILLQRIVHASLPSFTGSLEVRDNFRAVSHSNGHLGGGFLWPPLARKANFALGPERSDGGRVVWIVQHSSLD